MMRAWLIITFLLAMTGFVTGSALAEPEILDTPKQQIENPPPVEAVPEENIAIPETRQPDNKQGERDRGGRDNRPDRGKPDWHDDKNNNRPPKGKPYHQRPRVVYVYPRNYNRVIERTEVYHVYPSPTDCTTNYPNGYFPPFKAGDYLPDSRQWLKLPDYAAFGLPKPRVGEEWLFNDRDVILVSTSSAQILNAITLAAPIQ